jgi:hypothetical protein
VIRFFRPVGADGPEGRPYTYSLYTPELIVMAVLWTLIFVFVIAVIFFER